MEYIEEELEIHIKLLILTLWKGGYPHEILSFLFNHCIDGKTGEANDGTAPGRKVFWTPRGIVEELSEIPLARLCGILESEYIDRSGLPEPLINVCFTRFIHSKMIREVHGIIKSKDRAARKRWAGILNNLSGETVLADYFGKNPAAGVSDWIYKVRQNVRATIEKDDWLARPLEDLLDQCVAEDNITGRLKRYMNIFSGLKYFFIFFAICREKFDFRV